MVNKANDFTGDEIKYLNLLAQQFPNAQAASTEIINLEAIMRLPKGTEHFLTDIHGEYETFNHILRNASGVVRRKIEEIFGEKISEAEKSLLATLIYYPQEKLEALDKKGVINKEWYYLTLTRLIKVARVAARKYTQSKLRKAMPQDFAYIIDELLNETNDKKGNYVKGILNSIIEIDNAWHFVVAICRFIQRLLIAHLHVVGDIYDRGPDASKVMDTLIKYHSFDIQWGNHDIIWIGAACGVDALIAEVIRFSARYDNLDTIEDAYGINLLPLFTFALNNYTKEQCKNFAPKYSSSKNEHDSVTTSLIHKAISIIGWKLEKRIIQRNPNFNMDNRLFLDKIDYEKGTVIIDGEILPLIENSFPTIDPKDPYKLTDQEQEVLDKLRTSFLNCEKLQNHISVLINKGSMYLKYNSNLLFHGCIPMKDKNTFEEFDFGDIKLKGKELCDTFDRVVRRMWVNRNNPNALQQDFDLCWYLWCGPCSPLFGKKKMSTFERYFIADENYWKEESNPYFKLRSEEDTVNFILEEFELDPKKSHIVNGHTPVKVIKGEKPIKANGKLFVIDGSMSKAYRKDTGISGFTLIYNSTSLILVQHEPFSSLNQVIEDEDDIHSTRDVVELSPDPICVGDTDVGAEMKQKVNELKRLLQAYKLGFVKEQ